MALDKQFTEKIQAWLNADNHSDEDIRVGALLLLQLNKNRGLYERICRNPQRNVQKVEYELKKHLKIRLAGYTLNDVRKMDLQITPQIKSAIKVDRPPLLPKQTIAPNRVIVSVTTGKRPDHDRLPDNIKKLWTDNAERWKKIKATFELLKSLDAPCDRFEHLKMLKEAWYKYKKVMERYDNYSLLEDQVTVVKGNGLSPEQQKAVDVAQAYISRNLPLMLELVDEAKYPDFSQAARLEKKRSNLQKRVNTLLENGVLLSEARKDDLRSCDIKITLDA